MLFQMLNLLYFYISTFSSTCAVPNMAIYSSSLISCFPGIIIIIIIIIIIARLRKPTGIETCRIQSRSANQETTSQYNITESRRYDLSPGVTGNPSNSYTVLHTSWRTRIWRTATHNETKTVFH
jgi:hypothetical protein